MEHLENNVCSAYDVTCPVFSISSLGKIEWELSKWKDLLVYRLSGHESKTTASIQQTLIAYLLHARQWRIRCMWNIKTF